MKNLKTYFILVCAMHRKEDQNFKKWIEKLYKVICCKNLIK